MTENRKSWNIPVGKSDLITAYSGTKQILSYMPNPKSTVVVGVDVVETTDDKKE